ncbi:glycoside hydrolase [Candidatus Saccharibacteria bacterium]|nr:glycoside hydrolase [Candidatus Saccharibacteria bacterium]
MSDNHNHSNSPIPDDAQSKDLDAKALTTTMLAILDQNNQGDYTSPAKLYPHQWLWDSAFTAIGLRHIDPERAAREIASLVRGQWSNGMIPNMIFNPSNQYRLDRDFWSSWLSPFAPDHLATSGITQPPMLADAVVKVGEKLPKSHRTEFYRFMFEPLVQYHQWLYLERDPHNEGLTLQIHPWEVGLDNTPPWVHQLYDHSRPWWIALIEKLGLQGFINFIRRDRSVPPGQRISSLEALMLWDVVKRLRRKNYNIERIMHRTLFATQDISFNSIMVRNNTQLQTIANIIRKKLPSELLTQMKHSEQALDKLYDDISQQYYSRDFITHKLIKEPSIGTFLPLYAGTISKERASKLVKLLKDHKKYWLHHPVPSVPLDSSFFDADRYWQGPSWVNTNWLIIDGLERYNYTELADELRQKTIQLVNNQGAWEYFDPLNGRGLGAESFSWTAALTIDLLNQ